MVWYMKNTLSCAIVQQDPHFWQVLVTDFQGNRIRNLGQFPLEGRKTLRPARLPCFELPEHAETA